MQAGSARRSNPAPLADVARHCVIPEDIAFTRFYELIAPELPGMGVTLHQWQQDIWEVALGLREDGSLCCDVMGVTLSIARQAGKTWGVMAGLIAICLSRPGTTVVWSSHHDRTSSETLTKMAGIVEKPTIRPKMRARNPVVMTDDSRGVHFANGSRILFGARSSGFGRGFSEVDIQVYDECQFLLESALVDMLAAMNVSEIGLAFFMGTPPRPKETRLGVDEAFRRRRARAIEPSASKKPFKGVYVEFSADPDAPTDIDSAGFWGHLAIANPSFGFPVGRSAIERLVENMSAEDVSREVLGRWDEITRQFSPLNGVLWSAQVDIGPPGDLRPDGLAVDMSHDREISVSACWTDADRVHVEEVWFGVDEVRAVAMVESMWRANRRMKVVIDSMSPAASMVPALRTKNVAVHVGTSGDMQKACGLLVSDLEMGRLTHADQERLNEARDVARKRSIGKAGGWGWDRSDDSVSIAPLVSATLARLAASMIRKPTGTSSGGKVVSA